MGVFTRQCVVFCSMIVTLFEQSFHVYRYTPGGCRGRGIGRYHLSKLVPRGVLFLEHNGR